MRKRSATKTPMKLSQINVVKYMSSRKSIWAGMDRLEGKKEGSSYKNLEKEQKRQGYKPKSIDRHEVKGIRKALTKAMKD